MSVISLIDISQRLFESMLIGTLSCCRNGGVFGNSRIALDL